MADQTQARADERQEGVLVDVALAAVQVYKGSILSFNAAGYADVADASETFAGVAMESVDNSAGAAGDKAVRVWRSGVVELNCAAATQATVGKEAFVTDDNTVHFTPALGLIPIGIVVGYVSATAVRVDINRSATARAA